MATDHGMVPASAASCALTSTSWPRPRARAVEDGGDRADRAVDRRAVVREVARDLARRAGPGSPRPTARPTRPAPAAVRGASPDRGPLSPRSVSATCTRCGVSGSAEAVRPTPTFSTSTSASSRSSSSAPRPVVEVEHHAALVGVAVRVRERVRRILPLDADHVGAEVGEDAAAERTAQSVRSTTRSHDRGPSGVVSCADIGRTLTNQAGSVLPSDLAQPASRRLHRPLERLGVERDQAERDLEARHPFEVVEQRPVRVAAHVDPVGDRTSEAAAQRRLRCTRAGRRRRRWRGRSR